VEATVQYRIDRRKRRKLVTLLEYLDTPEVPGPEELIFGAYRVAESPSAYHQEIVGKLFLFLHDHVARRRLGSVWLAPLDVILAREPPLVVQPDLFVICRGGAAIVDRKVLGAPDLVVEVLSPRPRIGDLDERIGWFRDNGVRECWLVHELDRAVEILQFTPGMTKRRVCPADAPIESVVLPSFDRSLASMLD
jgi:Uma2 family endonuclease